MRRTLTGLAAATALTAALAPASQAETVRPQTTRSQPTRPQATRPQATQPKTIKVTATRATASGWSVAQTNTLPGEDGIKAIAVAPTGSAWAAGFQTVDGKSVPLVQRLLSGKWTTAKSPSGSLGEVGALDASSGKNVWAFGPTHAARWNGTKWTTTKLPSGYSVSDARALSASNVWAVGGDDVKSAVHWNGSSWKKVSLPVPARAIAGVSGTHLYAVGTNGNQPAVEHWTGSAWVLAKTPKLPLPEPDAVGVLNDVYAPTADDVWAAGGFEWPCGEDGDDLCSEPYLLHWDGKAWSTLTFDGDGGYGAFSRVTGDGGDGLWAMRYGWDPTLTHVSGDWASTVTAPRPSGHDIYLSALALRGTTVWAAGAAYPEGDPDDPTGNGVYLRTG